MSVAGYVNDATYNLNSFCPPGNGGTEGGIRPLTRIRKLTKRQTTIICIFNGGNL